MSRINETRHVSWHETYTRKFRLEASVYTNKQRWNNNKWRCECKELIGECSCDIFNLSICECKCDKSCEVGEYLDYKNCKCKKKNIY